MIVQGVTDGWAGEPCRDNIVDKKEDEERKAMWPPAAGEPKKNGRRFSPISYTDRELRNQNI